MEPSIPPAWSTGHVPNRIAGRPEGWLGALGGRLLALNRAQQDEVLALLGPLDGARVVEIGPGPGILLGMLAACRDVEHVVGVEPSRSMRRLATRRLAEAIAAGRVEVRAGAADATGLPDDAVDVVVTVNTVAIWPDLDAGAAEIARVLRPGGRALVSWHGGDRGARGGLGLTDDQLARIEAALGRHIGPVVRRHTPRSTVFLASPA
ncbi:class I SAM-dependent methyltransferase [Pseudonocardia sp. CA-107938]|uniref:class I SAM-dependent methyltransferase n=1 Tax=Pseudonocardia sp. CA-107938 TaxID=3240021 RepID=UPI003D8B6C1C